MHSTDEEADQFAAVYIHIKFSINKSRRVARLFVGSYRTENFYV